MNLLFQHVFNHIGSDAREIASDDQISINNTLNNPHKLLFVFSSYFPIANTSFSVSTYSVMLANEAKLGKGPMSSCSAAGGGALSSNRSNTTVFGISAPKPVCVCVCRFVSRERVWLLWRENMHDHGYRLSSSRLDNRCASILPW
jgi:hypothetical protein